jgi:polyhydroxyalkanoate synthesis regulator phasin
MKGKLAGGAIAGVLGLAVTGAAALAAFQGPDLAPAAATVADPFAAVQTEKDAPRDKIKDVLDKLVSSGTITQAQEDAIVKAFQQAASHDREGEALLKKILGDLTKLSSEYLGTPLGQLMQQLKDGKSLGEIANATPGKSRDGLITYVAGQVTVQVDQALASGKITPAQADKIKANLTERVTRFVDHKFERKAPPARTTKPQAPKPTPSASPKA